LSFIRLHGCHGHGAYLSPAISTTLSIFFRRTFACGFHHFPFFFFLSAYRKLSDRPFYSLFCLDEACEFFFSFSRSLASFFAFLSSESDRSPFLCNVCFFLSVIAFKVCLRFPQLFPFDDFFCASFRSLVPISLAFLFFSIGPDRH